jgi:hypothetical protein
LDSQNLAEGRLTTNYTWQELDFSSATSLAAGTPLCFLLMLNANSPAGDFQFRNAGAPTLLSHMLVSTGSTTAWTPAMTQSLDFQIYGTVNTLLPTTVWQYNLTGVRVSLRGGLGTLCRVRTTVRVPNEPWVSG